MRFWAARRYAAQRSSSPAQTVPAWLDTVPVAWGMVPLILFRGLQGAGAGAVQPIATTIVGDIYSPAERARVQGYISGVGGVAAVIGPILGAFLVQHVSWSLVFWINLPIGAATFVMFSRFLRASAERASTISARS